MGLVLRVKGVFNLNYKKRRKLANKVNQKIRRIIKKATGKKLPKSIEIDDIIPIKKGGSPTSLRNKRLIRRRINRRKAAK